MLLFWLGLVLSLIYVCSSQTPRSFPQPPEWDISKQGTLYLHIVAMDYTIPSTYEEYDAGTFLTRVLCWGDSENLDDIDQETSCGIPGPTIVLHPDDTEQRVVLVNNLIGIGHDTTTLIQAYHDQDVINLHVHGLNVYPKVDDVVDIWLDPICCDSCDSTTDNCRDPSDGPNTHWYNYTIHKTHYPGTHWYHGHWHGATALHVNGGFYGVIKMEANEEITNLECYEPQVLHENDLVVEASFLWLNTDEDCSPLISSSSACSFQGGNFGDNDTFPDYVYPAGIVPFKFALEGWCWILCKYKNSGTASVKEQYEKSHVNYSVSFDNQGPWSGLSRVQTFLINGVAEPQLQMNTGEWYRLRLVNTNMAYLIWQINDNDDESTDFLDAVQAQVCQTYLISYDGVYFDDGPRDVFDSPYLGSIVLPPGGRADVMVACFQPGLYTVISSNNTRDSLFDNAPVPNFVAKVMDINVTGATIVDATQYIPTNVSQCINNGYNKTQLIYGDGSSGGIGYLPSEFIPKSEWSPYLTDTQDLVYPDVTSYCQTMNNNNAGSGGTFMNQCNIVLQHITPGSGGDPSPNVKISVNHIPFSPSTPLLNLTTNITHEWLVTSNFHQFHQHIWPFQMQTDIVDGWLAKKGEWRDVVGAPGSYIARSNFYGYNIERDSSYDMFFRGKLIQHCHFVPHEDHGLMAYHQLILPNVTSSFSDTPIVPVSGNTDFSISYRPDRPNWVTDADCEQFLAISAVIIDDSNTIIVIFFRQFTYQGYCFFGYLPIVVFRPGQVTNAFIGFGLWGSYQNDWINNARMNGRALVFTLQHPNDDSCILCDLEEVHVSEVELNNIDHDFSFPLGNANTPFTPAKCSDVSNGGQFLPSRRQYRYWYCVRPKTINDYPNTPFNATNYEYIDGRNASEAFGYIWAYGEGQFYKDTMHASRGSCGMFFNFSEAANGVSDTEEATSIEDQIDFLEAEAFECQQTGQQIGATSGQKVIIDRTAFQIESVRIDKQTFINESGFDIDGTSIPSAIPTEMPTPDSTSTSTTYQVRVNFKTSSTPSIPDNLYISLSSDGTTYSHYMALSGKLSATSGKQEITVDSDINFGNAGNIQHMKVAWSSATALASFNIRILNQDNNCGNNQCSPPDASNALRSYNPTCTGTEECCISTCDLSSSSGTCETPESSCVGLPFGNDVVDDDIETTEEPIISIMTTSVSGDDDADIATILQLQYSVVFIIVTIYALFY